MLSNYKELLNHIYILCSWLNKTILPLHSNIAGNCIAGASPRTCFGHSKDGIKVVSVVLREVDAI